ncbi:family A G protein-coupled receptor-like protein [Rhizoclosmatium globosum]|uniref:Family A G protein-coupled receptor-like protein n=1 Tax=Rhizoclosmatium globosum TaxID=329046 RepID=A0A1Y2BTR3_9FUNG|nr:family A G protein-coupled receptor-like protein [Rhizoclosmatium globosum]|eukprot:ORY38136.1 family A G protein-coupled receptor-like protein [Rhizoclosmatium globosum]
MTINMDSTVLYQSIMAATAAIASVLNMCIIASTMCRTRKLGPTTYITFWLCCSDSLIVMADFLINALTLSLYLIVDHEPIFGNFRVCHVHGFMQIFGGTSSLLLCFGLTTFRYMVIVRQENLSNRAAPKFVCAVYLCAMVVASLPFLLNSPDTFALHPSQSYCCTDWTKRDIKSRIMIAINFATLTPPVLFIGYAYYKIYQKVRVSVSEVKKSVVGSIPYIPNTETFSHLTETKVPLAGDGGKQTVEADIIADEVYEAPERPSFNPRKSSATVVNMSYSSESNTNGFLKHVRRDSRAEIGNAFTRVENEQMNLLKQSIAIVSAFLIGWTPYLILLIMILVNFATLTPPLVFIAFAYYRIYEKVKTSVSEVKKSIAESTPYLRGKGTFTRVNDTIARLAGDGGKHFNDSQEYDVDIQNLHRQQILENPLQQSSTCIVPAKLILVTTSNQLLSELCRRQKVQTCQSYLKPKMNN